ncbi:transposase [Streptomyces bobili]|uniref:transposase n=1 Tax=Streptomyces bobili TaxID=67280 RepID=UPI0033A6FFE5
MKQYAQRQDWLTIVHLPAYTTELNPVEPVWAHTKERIANRAYRSISELRDAMWTTLRCVQRHCEPAHQIPHGNRATTQSEGVKSVVKHQ